MKTNHLLIRRVSCVVLCVMVLLPASNLVFSQTRPPAQKMEKQVRVSVSDLLPEPKNAAIVTPNVAGYTENGKFVPDGPVQLKYASTRTALRGVYRAGKPAGTWRIFYPSGQLQSEVIYRAGKPDGSARRYWEDGKLAREEIYAGGKIKRWVIYNQQGKRISEFKKQNDQIVYAYRLTRQGAIIADAGLTSVKFLGYPVNFAKACRLRDDGSFRCKTPYQIWRDLNTFLEPEMVSEILEELISIYGLPGLDGGKGILTQCADGWTATPVSKGKAVVQEASQHSAQMTDSELFGMTKGCRDAQIAGLTGGGGKSGGEGVSGSDAGYQNQVSSVKGAMDSMVRACEARQQFDSSSGVAQAGQALTTAAEFADILSFGLGVGGLANDFLHNGYGPWRADYPPARGYSQSESRFSPKEPDGSYIKQTRTGGGFLEDSKMLSQEHVHGDGSTDRIEYGENGYGKVIHTDTEGNVTSELEYWKRPDGSYQGKERDYSTNTQRYGSYRNNRWYFDPASPIDDTKPLGTPVPKPSPGPSGTQPPPPPAPEPGVPCDECRAGNCKALKEFLGSISGRCDRSGWQTYECSRLVGMFHGCVDSAEIRPGPDGDMTCSGKNMSVDEARRLECRKLQMLQSFTGPEDADSCSRISTLVGRVPRFGENICNDPRAHCLPDTVIDRGLLEERPLDRERPPSVPMRNP